MINDYFNDRLEYNLKRGKSKNKAKIAAMEDYYKDRWAVPSYIFFKF